MKVSKIFQIALHIIAVMIDIAYVVMIGQPDFGSDKILIGFIVCITVTMATLSAPAVKEWYKTGSDENESKQKKENEISDETIMKILNAVGYEEKSWIEEVRKHIKQTEK